MKEKVPGVLGDPVSARVPKLLITVLYIYMYIYIYIYTVLLLISWTPAPTAGHRGHLGPSHSWLY